MPSFPRRVLRSNSRRASTTRNRCTATKIPRTSNRCITSRTSPTTSMRAPISHSRHTSPSSKATLLRPSVPPLCTPSTSNIKGTILPISRQIRPISRLFRPSLLSLPEARSSSLRLLRLLQICTRRLVSRLRILDTSPLNIRRISPTAKCPPTHTRHRFSILRLCLRRRVKCRHLTSLNKITSKLDWMRLRNACSEEQGLKETVWANLDTYTAVIWTMELARRLRCDTSTYILYAWTYKKH